MTTDAGIAESASVRQTQLGENIKIWRDASITRSTLCDRVSVGDFSIVRDSVLEFAAEIGRRNTVDHAIIGRGTYTGEFCMIKYCEIGKYCSISWNVSIGGANHAMDRLSTAPLHRLLQTPQAEPYSSFQTEPLRIGNDVWIGAGAHILRPVTIGDGAVIAANAVVTRDVPPYAIYAGVPARKIGQRFSDEIVEALLELRWWDFPAEKLHAAQALLSRRVDVQLIEELKSL